MRRTLLALIFCGCTVVQPPPPPPPGGQATCKDVCGRLVALKCEAGKPTPEGTSCEDVCKNATSADSPIAWNLDCRARASSCDAADSCEVR